MCKFSVGGRAMGEGSDSVSCCPELTSALVLACNAKGPVASIVDPVTTLRLVLDLSGHTHKLTPHAHAHTLTHSRHMHTHTHTMRVHTQPPPHTRNTHTQQVGTLLVWQDWQDLTGFMNGTRTQHTHTQSVRERQAGRTQSLSVNLPPQPGGCQDL